jgi:cell division initiation protein
VLDGANREKELVVREAQFKAEEIIREAQQHVVEMEVHLRNLKMERLKFLREVESLMDRTRRHLQEEAPDIYMAAPPTLNLESLDLSELDETFPTSRRPKAEG